MARNSCTRLPLPTPQETGWCVFCGMRQGMTEPVDYTWHNAKIDHVFKFRRCVGCVAHNGGASFRDTVHNKKDGTVFVRTGVVMPNGTIKINNIVEL